MAPTNIPMNAEATERDHALAQAKLAGQHAAEHACEEDLVEVEELAEPDHDDPRTMKLCDLESVRGGVPRLGMAGRGRELVVSAMLMTLSSRSRSVKRRSDNSWNGHSFRTSRTASDQSEPDSVTSPDTATSCPSFFPGDARRRRSGSAAGSRRGGRRVRRSRRAPGPAGADGSAAGRGPTRTRSSSRAPQRRRRSARPRGEGVAAVRGGGELVRRRGRAGRRCRGRPLRSSRRRRRKASPRPPRRARLRGFVGPAPAGGEPVGALGGEAHRHRRPGARRPSSCAGRRACPHGLLLGVRAGERPCGPSTPPTAPPAAVTRRACKAPQGHAPGSAGSVA